ncbi:MAG: methylated-DNA--[protein]-cysteine S-methyltransferase [Planctomycetota bacterium]
MNATFETPLGLMRVETVSEAVTGLRFLDGSEARPVASCEPLVARLRDEIGAYFDALASGRTPPPFAVPLRPRLTAFQREVLDVVTAIPPGSTRSYASIARAVGRPDAARAVGRANATNPLALLIPCHRVVGADGSLTGYAGGLWRKRALLEAERVGTGLFGSSKSVIRREYGPLGGSLSEGREFVAIADA